MLKTEKYPVPTETAVFRTPREAFNRISKEFYNNGSLLGALQTAPSLMVSAELPESNLKPGTYPIPWRINTHLKLPTR